MASKKVWKQFFIFLLVCFLLSLGMIALISGADLKVILLSAIAIGAAFALPGLIIGLNGFRLKNYTKRCTAHTKGKLVTSNTYKTVDRDRISLSYSFSYMVQGIEIISSTMDYEGIDQTTPVGTEFDIWYNPNKPEQFFVAEDGELKRDIKISKGFLFISIILLIAAILVFIFI